MATATKAESNYKHSDLKETKKHVLTDTWDEWVNKDTVVDRMFFGGIGRQNERCVMQMLGGHIFVETFWASGRQRVIAQDFSVKEHDRIMEIAYQHGAFWEEGYYANPGYGWPVWHGKDGMERCFAFLKDYWISFMK